jgi:tRNA-specific 2-thiouridylase
MAANVLYVVSGHDHPALYVDEVTITDMNWISGELPHTHWVYTAKTRYRSPDAPCEIERVDAERAVIRFASPQWAVTPGQSLVMYESRVCLGGGIIESARMGGQPVLTADLQSLAD